MKVERIMRSEVRHVGAATDLATAARLMDEVGCGILPVVGEDGGLEGVLTDRDVCLALGRTDRRPSELRVGPAMSREIHACSVGDDLHRALAVMSNHRVRRLPVLEPDGRLRGLLTLDDIALHAQEHVAGELGDLLFVDVGRTLAAICEPAMPALAG